MGASVTSSLFGNPVVLGIWKVAVGGEVLRFEEFALGDRPARADCVYSFARLRADRIAHLYIGRAADLPRRLERHEALAEAEAEGANRLLVHCPGYASALPAADAEHLLLAAHRPPLNARGAGRPEPRETRRMQM